MSANRKEERFMEAVRRLSKDPQPMQITSSKFDVWMVLAVIQLACRHPEFTGPTRQIAEKWAREVGASLTATDPDLRMLLAMGWEKQFDEPREMISNR